MDKRKKDIISIRDFSKKEILHILKIATEFENNPQPNLLKNKIISMLFFEPSTRTRLSFISAAQKLGAYVHGFDSELGTSKKKGETLSDTIKMAEAYSDMIVIRHYNNGAAKLTASISTKPVINAGDGTNQHPSQTLLDIYTIQKEKKSLENLKIAFVGDLKYGRTVHSLVQAMKLFNSTMYFVSPPSLKIPKCLIMELKDAKINYHILETFDKKLSKFDILYMTRIQKERFPDIEEYNKIKDIYVINKKNIVAKCKRDMMIMHPLPRVKEIAKDLDDTPYAKYFEQAANGIPVRQAILALALNKVGRL